MTNESVPEWLIEASNEVGNAARSEFIKAALSVIPDENEPFITYRSTTKTITFFSKNDYEFSVSMEKLIENFLVDNEIERGSAEEMAMAEEFAEVLEKAARTVRERSKALNVNRSLE